jgi:hypothetical protein
MSSEASPTLSPDAISLMSSEASPTLSPDAISLMSSEASPTLSPDAISLMSSQATQPLSPLSETRQGLHYCHNDNKKQPFDDQTSVLGEGAAAAPKKQEILNTTYREEGQSSLCLRGESDLPAEGFTPVGNIDNPEFNHSGVVYQGRQKTYIPDDTDLSILESTDLRSDNDIEKPDPETSSDTPEMVSEQTKPAIKDQETIYSERNYFTQKSPSKVAEFPNDGSPVISVRPHLISTPQAEYKHQQKVDSPIELNSGREILNVEWDPMDSTNNRENRPDSDSPLDLRVRKNPIHESEKKVEAYDIDLTNISSCSKRLQRMPHFLHQGVTTIKIEEDKVVIHLENRKNDGSSDEPDVRHLGVGLKVQNKCDKTKQVQVVLPHSLMKNYFPITGSNLKNSLPVATQKCSSNELKDNSQNLTLLHNPQTDSFAYTDTKEEDTEHTCINISSESPVTVKQPLTKFSNPSFLAIKRTVTSFPNQSPIAIKQSETSFSSPGPVAIKRAVTSFCTPSPVAIERRATSFPDPSSVAIKQPVTSFSSPSPVAIKRPVMEKTDAIKLGSNVLQGGLQQPGLVWKDSHKPVIDFPQSIKAQKRFTQLNRYTARRISQGLEGKLPTNIQKASQDLKGKLPFSVQKASQGLEGESRANFPKIFQDSMENLPTKGQQISQETVGKLPTKIRQISQDSGEKLPTDIKQICQDAVEKLPTNAQHSMPDLLRNLHTNDNVSCRKTEPHWSSEISVPTHNPLYKRESSSSCLFTPPSNKCLGDNCYSKMREDEFWLKRRKITSREIQSCPSEACDKFSTTTLQAHAPSVAESVQQRTSHQVKNSLADLMSIKSSGKAAQQQNVQRFESCGLLSKQHAQRFESSSPLPWKHESSSSSSQQLTQRFELSTPSPELMIDLEEDCQIVDDESLDEMEEEGECSEDKSARTDENANLFLVDKNAKEKHIQENSSFTRTNSKPRKRLFPPPPPIMSSWYY